MKLKYHYLAQEVKRAICILILLSMILHCASRLGLISYLHSKRHDIAYRIGLTAEIPIAMCNAEHFSKTAPLQVHDHNDSDKSLPSQIFKVREIVLFVECAENFKNDLIGIQVNHQTERPIHSYQTPARSIFHPPCEA